MTELFNRSLILEEINNLLFYRNIVSLERIFSNSDELEDVIWVSKEEVFRTLNGLDKSIFMARKGAIARYLIEKWAAGLV